MAEYNAHCGICGVFSDPCVASKSATYKALKKTGWIYVSIWGWLCQKCAKTGCGTKTRKMEYRPRISEVYRPSGYRAGNTGNA